MDDLGHDSAVHHDCVTSPLFGVTPRQIINGYIRSVAEDHQVAFAEIVGPHRDRRIVKARHQAILGVIARWPHMSLPQVGRFFNRDHSTILAVLGKHGVPPRKGKAHYAKFPPK